VYKKDGTQILKPIAEQSIYNIAFFIVSNFYCFNSDIARLHAMASLLSEWRDVGTQKSR